MADSEHSPPQYPKPLPLQDPLEVLRKKIYRKITSLADRERLEEFLKGQLPAYKGRTECKSGGLFPDEKEKVDDSPQTYYLVKDMPDLAEVLSIAIAEQDSETIDLLFHHRIVSPKTPISPEIFRQHRLYYSPLIKVLLSEEVNISIVKQLLEHGADPNSLAWAGFWKTKAKSYSWYKRTPLMVAAGRGLLPIVKLLCEPPYSVDDSIISPWGETALRLASAGGHRAVVDYLPARRGGGLLRCKRRVVVADARVEVALGVFYIVPRFFIWSIPKHVIVLPLREFCKWCWEHKHEFLPWCKHQVVELPKRVARGAKAVWTGIKKTGRTIVNSSKAVWKFGTETFPKWFWTFITETLPKALKKIGTWLQKLFMETLPQTLKDISIWLQTFLIHTLPEALKNTAAWLQKFVVETLPQAVKNIAAWLRQFITGALIRQIKAFATWIWELITWRLIKALRTAAEWVWSGIRAFANALWDVISRFLSLIHTILLALITFLRNVTLKDIWNGLCDLMRSIFVTLPKTIWEWVKDFEWALRSFLIWIFGKNVGPAIWVVLMVLKELILWIPRKLCRILMILADLVAGSVYEVRIFINPKA
ncbi:hypothetical protein D9613_009515 [Agrocybe pediades]|uniref:Uncharacterized protein n=1 Tax=Agrocybe pediades TaxID=84607 RepID=A0A8H4R332_9AGAR|nr:hypothetical protein D9613_009515 [Agrocybe pediades]